MYAVIIPYSTYNRAVKLADSGKYIEAYNLLDSLNGYGKSEEKMEEISLEYLIERVSTGDVQKGESIYFGSYEQDNDENNGKEDIEWLVLDECEGKVLLVSKYALDCMPYNDTNVDILWGDSTIRQWLNNEFFNSSFNENEQEGISTTIIDQGGKTENKIFLLSVYEANRYDAMSVLPTAYAKARGATVVYHNGSTYAYAWLRTRGEDGDKAAYVYNGDIYYDVHVATEHMAVRPAMWIECDSE